MHRITTGTDIPNRIKQAPQCCVYCGKIYKTRSNMNKHINLCELIHKNKRGQEEEIELPSQKNMFKMLLELGEKYSRLEKKVEEMNKYVVKQKKKINILDWLNNSSNNNNPEIVFERLIEKIELCDEDMDYLMKNSFYETLNYVFSRNIYTLHENENKYPIAAFIQKSHVFYIYDKIDETKIEWHELSREKLVKFLNRTHMKIIKYFNDWKKKQSQEIVTNDSFATICDKTHIKLMSINFNNDATLGRIKSAIYARINKDMKVLVEFEFEF
jgi:hypothetical protein